MGKFSKNKAREFCPAVIELEDTPASPLGRLMIWLVVLLFTSGVTWASIGKVDIVAVASGKIVPNGQIKKIQSIESGRIKSVNVIEGQSVTKGTVLLTLEDESLLADKMKVSEEKSYQEITIKRIRLLLSRLNGNTTEALDEIAIVRWQEYREALNTNQSGLEKLQAEMRSLAAQLEKYEQLLPIIRKKTENLKKLNDRKLVADQMYLEQKQQFIETRQDYKSAVSRKDEINAAIDEIQSKHDQYQSEFKRNLLELESEGIKTLALLKQDMIKIEKRVEACQIKSPVNGIVQQINTHTVGGVVSAAETLMVVVPDNARLEVEAFLENKDIGFIRPGQPVEIKIDAFPFTKYGVVDGELVNISEDAILDEVKGLVFKAIVSIDNSSASLKNKSIFLSPGMSASIEAKTGKRRLIEYFLSPIIRYKNESIRER